MQRLARLVVAIAEIQLELPLLVGILLHDHGMPTPSWREGDEHLRHRRGET